MDVLVSIYSDVVGCYIICTCNGCPSEWTKLIIYVLVRTKKYFNVIQYIIVVVLLNKRCIKTININ